MCLNFVWYMYMIVDIFFHIWLTFAKYTDNFYVYTCYSSIIHKNVKSAFILNDVRGEISHRFQWTQIQFFHYNVLILGFSSYLTSRLFSLFNIAACKYYTSVSCSKVMCSVISNSYNSSVNLMMLSSKYISFQESVIKTNYETIAAKIFWHFVLKQSKESRDDYLDSLLLQLLLCLID